MALLIWTDDLSVGIAEFDEQHKRLVAMLNQLYDAMLEGHGAEVLTPVLAGLIDYTKIHFAAEERIMRRHNFPGLARHKEEHDALTWKVMDLHERLDGGQMMLSVETLAFLKTWLTEHIMGTDKDYSEFFAHRGLK